jgi:hypothetical protein
MNIIKVYKASRTERGIGTTRLQGQYTREQYECRINAYSVNRKKYISKSTGRQGLSRGNGGKTSSVTAEAGVAFQQ